MNNFYVNSFDLGENVLDNVCWYWMKIKQEGGGK